MTRARGSGLRKVLTVVTLRLWFQVRLPIKKINMLEMQNHFIIYRYIRNVYFFF